MTFSTINFDPFTPLAANTPILLHKCCFFAWNTLLQSSHRHMCWKFVYTNRVRGVACEK